MVSEISFSHFLFRFCAARQLGKELFVPGLFVASYTLILSILAAVLLFYKFSRKDLRLPR